MEWQHKPFADQIFCVSVHVAGRVAAWGSNEYGQLGTGGSIVRRAPGSKPPLRRKPTSVMPLAKENVVFAACGYAHTIVISNEGHVYSFGYNHTSPIGLPRQAWKLTDVLVCLRALGLACP